VEYWEPVMTRINSTLVNNDILGTLTNDADKKLDNMFHLINKENRGAILSSTKRYSRSIIELKDLQTQGIYKAPQVKMDNKDFGIGAQILHDIDISKKISHKCGTNKTSWDDWIRLRNYRICELLITYHFLK
jgi:3,4-dihydroxy 2-butanone 4-phosphate synthase/GTP cyclohydrolase II